MNPEKTAIVLIECQNDFLSKSGKLHGLVKGVLESNHVVANINDLIKRAREKGWPIIHVPIVFSSDYREMGDEPYGIMKAVKDSGAFQKGSDGAKIAESIEIRDGDIVMDGKSSICAFSGTNLDFVLKNRGIMTIALGGLLTNVCIESTMRTAYDKGYEVYTLKDCSATLGEEEQKIAIQYNWPMFSIPVTHDEFLNRSQRAAAG